MHVKKLKIQMGARLGLLAFLKQIHLFRNSFDSVKTKGGRGSLLNNSSLTVAISGADSNCKKLVQKKAASNTGTASSYPSDS